MPIVRKVLEHSLYFVFTSLKKNNFSLFFSHFLFSSIFLSFLSLFLSFSLFSLSFPYLFLSFLSIFLSFPLFSFYVSSSLLLIFLLGPDFYPFLMLFCFATLYVFELILFLTNPHTSLCYQRHLLLLVSSNSLL